MIGGHVYVYQDLLSILALLKDKISALSEPELEVALRPVSKGGLGILDFIQDEQLSIEAAYPRVSMIKNLINNLEHPFFKATLEAATHEMVSFSRAYSQAILHFILSRDQGVPPGQIFSESESLLLRISSAMLHCNAGKSEGLFVAYRIFLLKEDGDRYQIGAHNDAVSEGENMIKGYVHDFVIDRILLEMSNLHLTTVIYCDALEF